MLQTDRQTDGKLLPGTVQIFISCLDWRLDDYILLLGQIQRGPKFYYNYALCNAELGDVKKVCDILSKANKIFGPFKIKSWLNNPIYSKFSEDRFFKIFVRRIDNKIDEIKNLNN